MVLGQNDSASTTLPHILSGVSQMSTAALLHCSVVQPAGRIIHQAHQQMRFPGEPGEQFFIKAIAAKLLHQAKNEILITEICRLCGLQTISSRLIADENVWVCSS